MTTPNVDALAQLDPAELLETLEALVQHRTYNRLQFFRPYPRQLEFFGLGTSKQQRLLFAGNQMGKSEAGAYETALHLTGLYPADWNGRTWDKPVSGWAAGESTTVTRDVAQTKLCGKPGVEALHGTGLIPLHCFAEKPTRARGAVADAYDSLAVYHFRPSHQAQQPTDDGISTLSFKSYEQGRAKFQGSTIDFIWWDEEPPVDVYTEGEARWSATGGMSFMTFTPLLGYSEVVCQFLRMTAEDAERRGWVRMGYKDALHMTPEMIADQMRKYPKHQHKARMEGEPLLGSGQIFLVARDQITFPVGQFIPHEWAKIWGIDFGISHPFGAVLLAWDRDTDTIYWLHSYKRADATPLIHSEAIRAIGPDVPVAWPHDGHVRDKGSGEELASQYRKFNLRMLPEHATYPEGGYSTEAVVLEMQQRFEKAPGPGSLRVREDQEEALSEISMYHRKDGLIVKFNDDLLSAAAKGIMMRRYARPGPLGYRPRPEARERSVRGPVINPWTGRPHTG